MVISVDIDFEDILDELSERDWKRILKKFGTADLVETCKDAGLIVMNNASPDDSERWRDLAADLRRAAAEGDLRHLEVLLLRMETMAGVPRQMLGDFGRRHQWPVPNPHPTSVRPAAAATGATA